MPKRKSPDNEEDTFPAGASEAAETESESSPRKQTRKKEENSLRKRAKVKPDSEEANSALNNSNDSKIKIQKNAEGDSFIDLGKKKRATVRTFKGMTLLDIREYYGKDGEEKPGKKGISLSLEQWQFLRDNFGAIDGLFAEQKKRYELDIA